MFIINETRAVTFKSVSCQIQMYNLAHNNTVVSISTEADTN